MSFSSLGLCDELLKSVAEQGYTTPSPIQIDAIPVLLSGRDVMAVAHTGTGKTAGFTLPMLQLLSEGTIHDGTIHDDTIHDGTIHDGTIHDGTIHDGTIHDGTIHDGTIHDGTIHDGTIHEGTIHDGTIHEGTIHEGTVKSGPNSQAKCVRALVITPTRELAAQVASSVQNYSQHMNIRSAAVFGGVRIEPQIAQLQAGLDVLIATPGRLIDLYNQKAIKFDQLEILVLDEADRMLDLGFIDDIRRIQMLLPTQRQTLMFSATFSEEIKSLAKGMLNNPHLIEVADARSTLDSVKQKIYYVDKSRKTQVLIQLIKNHKWRQVLVFNRTKQGADSLVLQLENAGINAASIHANRTQHARTLALEGFKNRNIVVLVATDIASRGIDVNQLPCVVNFDLPYVPEDYVHRIGRTGRAGTSGLAVSLFSDDESKQLQSIERLIGRKFARETLTGFEPINKGSADSSDDGKNEKNGKNGKNDENDEYGNFEADPKPRLQSKGRGSRRSR